MSLSKRHRSQALNEVIIICLQPDLLIKACHKSEQREDVDLLCCNTGVTKIQGSQRDTISFIERQNHHFLLFTLNKLTCMGSDKVYYFIYSFLK